MKQMRYFEILLYELIVTYGFVYSSVSGITAKANSKGDNSSHLNIPLLTLSMSSSLYIRFVFHASLSVFTHSKTFYSFSNPAV